MTFVRKAVHWEGVVARLATWAGLGANLRWISEPEAVERLQVGGTCGRWVRGGGAGASPAAAARALHGDPGFRPAPFLVPVVLGGHGGGPLPCWPGHPCVVTPPGVLQLWHLVTAKTPRCPKQPQDLLEGLHKDNVMKALAWLLGGIEAAKARVALRPYHTSPRPEFARPGRYGAMVMVMHTQEEVMELVANTPPPPDLPHITYRDTKQLAACLDDLGANSTDLKNVRGVAWPSGGAPCCAPPTCRSPPPPARAVACDPQPGCTTGQKPHPAHVSAGPN
jgi:hypothetical protein